MEHQVHNLDECEEIPAAEGSNGPTFEPLEAVDRLERQLEKLRARCLEHTEAQQHLAEQLAAAEAGKRDLSEQSQSLAAREQALSERFVELESRESEIRQQQAALVEQEAVLRQRQAQIETDFEQREAALADRERSLQERESGQSEELRRQQAALEDQAATLQQREDAVSAAQKAIAVREHELDRVKAKLEGIKQSLRTIVSGGRPVARGGSPRSDDLEGLIDSTMRQAIDARHEADEVTARLEAAAQRAQSDRNRAEAAEKAAAQLTARVETLQEQLRESQLLCARVQGDMETFVLELRGEIKRIAAERDQLRQRLERQEDRMARAGLEIQWVDPPKIRKRRAP